MAVARHRAATPVPRTSPEHTAVARAAHSTLINLTDDGCGSTCSSACATNVA
ncbi:FxLD family lanthipeptide [Streptomyces sp. NPDC059037]|uniref:FxLD family lanthipeptide n=1 Tax=Streptomyces sp. NPDC059037 TaxID=3346710 RepID=UPI00368A8CF4